MIEKAKNILYATVGAATFTYEKATEVIDELIEKGKITVDEGKELSEELSREFKKSSEDIKSKVIKDIQDIKPITKEELLMEISRVEFKYNAEIALLNARIDELEEIINKDK